MGLDGAFDDWQAAVNADPSLIKMARARRDSFQDALVSKDIESFLPIGSVARGSQIEPLKDVDLIVVYKRDLYPDWGETGGSAQSALEDLADRVRDSLGESSGTSAEHVRLVKPGNHAVKCWIDDPDDEDAFTVDVVPALEEGDHLIIPESENRTWIETHPKFLLDAVATRQSDWRYFVPLVRVLKRWSRDQASGMLPLVVEVLALKHMSEDERPRSLADFFTAAAAVIDAPVQDPSGVGGTIQPDLDIAAARKALEHAADLSWTAVQTKDDGDSDRAQCIWRKLFGSDFPAPPGGCSDKGKGKGAPALLTTRPVRDSAQG